MKVFSYDVKVKDRIIEFGGGYEDRIIEFGSGHSGIILAEDKETAEKEVAEKYCRRKTQKILSIELEEITSGMFETRSYIDSDDYEPEGKEFGESEYIDEQGHDTRTGETYEANEEAWGRH